MIVSPDLKIIKDFRLKLKVQLLMNSLFAIDGYLIFHVNEILRIQFKQTIKFIDFSILKLLPHEFLLKSMTASNS